MKLLADEGVGKPIVDALRNAGFDVLYILETNPGTGDEFILSFANTEQRILLTQDKDVERPFEKASIILNLLLAHTNELINAFSVIQPNAIRMRK